MSEKAEKAPAWEDIASRDKDTAKAVTPTLIQTFRKSARASKLFDYEDLRAVTLMLVTFSGGVVCLEDNVGELWYVHVHGLEVAQNGGSG